jgi:hypothetical protein
VYVMEDRYVLPFIGSASVTLQEEKDYVCDAGFRERDFILVEHDYCVPYHGTLCTTRECGG